MMRYQSDSNYSIIPVISGFGFECCLSGNFINESELCLRLPGGHLIKRDKISQLDDFLEENPDEESFNDFELKGVTDNMCFYCKESYGSGFTLVGNGSEYDICYNCFRESVDGMIEFVENTDIYYNSPGFNVFETSIDMVIGDLVDNQLVETDLYVVLGNTGTQTCAGVSVEGFTKELTFSNIIEVLESLKNTDNSDFVNYISDNERCNICNEFRHTEFYSIGSETDNNTLPVCSDCGEILISELESFVGDNEYKIVSRKI